MAATVTKIPARDLTTGMILVVGFCGGSEKITRAGRSSAGIHAVIELADGSTQYHRLHALVEVWC